MKYRSFCLLITCSLLVLACQFSVPLSTVQDIDIDSALLGSWTMLPEDNDPNASMDSMSVSRSSDTEYSLTYVSEGVNLLFRAYLINPAGDTLLQLELLEGDKGPLSENDETPRYIVARYSVEGETLLVKTMNTSLISRDIDSTEALLKAYLNNKDNPDLFGNPGRFEKT